MRVRKTVHNVYASAHDYHTTTDPRISTPTRLYSSLLAAVSGARHLRPDPPRSRPTSGITPRAARIPRPMRPRARIWGAGGAMPLPDADTRCAGTSDRRDTYSVRRERGKEESEDAATSVKSRRDWSPGCFTAIITAPLSRSSSISSISSLLSRCCCCLEFARRYHPIPQSIPAPPGRLTAHESL